MSVNLAVIGLGRVGTIHARNAFEDPGLSLACVVDSDEEKAHRFAKELHCQAIVDPQSVFDNPEIDAVAVCTPTLTHYELVMRSLDSGKDVFAEKPLGVDLGQIDECYGLADQEDRILFLAFQRRFDPAFAALIRSARAGELGQLQFVRSTSRDSPMPSLDYLKTSCGIFHDCLVHDLDLICQTLDEYPVEVHTHAHCFNPEIAAIDDVDTVIVSMKFASGAIASIETSRKSVYGYDQRLEVLGSDGMWEVANPSSDSLRQSTGAGRSLSSIEYSFPQRYRIAYRKELLAFAQCVRERIEAPVSHEQARMNYIVAEAMEESYRTNRSVGIEND